MLKGIEVLWDIFNKDSILSVLIFCYYEINWVITNCYSYSDNQLLIIKSKFKSSSDTSICATKLLSASLSHQNLSTI